MAFDPMILTGPGAIKSFGNYMFPDPSKGAMGDLNKIPSTIKPYYDPYINAGNSALPGYQDFMNQLMRNPDQIMKMLGAGYQQSPGYKFNLEQGTNAINNASAAGGMLGTPQHQQIAGEMASGLASKDYGDYMDRALKMLGLGAQGTGGLIQQGGQMSSDLATALAQALMSKSNLRYAGQANQNQQTGSLIGNVIGGLSSFL